MPFYENFYGAARRGAAVGSSAVLGYISGGPRAAIKAATWTNRNLPKMKRKATGSARKVIKKRRVMKRKTIKKYKKRVTRTRKLKTGTRNSVKALIRKEISKDTPTGTYHKNFGGCLLRPPSGSTFNKQILSDGVFFSVGSAVRDLAFFTPRIFVDAASVLFRAKSRNLNPDLAAGNFSDPQIKFNVSFASVKINIQNVHLFKIKLTLYEVSSKHLEEDKFTDDYVDAMSATNFNQVTLSTAGPTSLFIKPTMIPGLMKRYNIKTKTVILDVGESITHYMKMSPFLFKLGDYYDGSVLQAFAPYSKQIVYAYEPMFVSVYDSTATSVAKAGRVYTTGLATTDTKKLGNLLVEVNEKFIIDAPSETAGVYSKDVFALFEGYETITTPTSNLQITKDILSTITSTYVPQ